MKTIDQKNKSSVAEAMKEVMSQKIKLEVTSSCYNSYGKVKWN